MEQRGIEGRCASGRAPTRAEEGQRNNFQIHLTDKTKVTPARLNTSSDSSSSSSAPVKVAACVPKERPHLRRVPQVPKSKTVAELKATISELEDGNGHLQEIEEEHETLLAEKAKSREYSTKV